MNGVREPGLAIVRAPALDSPLISVAALQARGIRAVVFDKDATLIDSLGAWAAAERALVGALLRHYELSPGLTKPVARAMLAAIGVSDEAYEPQGIMATGSSDQLLEALRGELGRYLGYKPSAEAFRRQASRELARLYPHSIDSARPMRGATELLLALEAAGMPLSLITADERAHTLAELEKLAWRARFSYIACADDEGQPKPAPYHVHAFARLAGLKPRQLAVIGDGDTDEAMARSAAVGLFVRIGGEVL